MHTLHTSRPARIRLAAALFCSLGAATAMTALAGATLATMAVSAEAAMQRTVRLAQGKSVVVRLPATATDVLIGDPKVASAIVRSKRVAYIFARGLGQTNIFFLDKYGRQVLNLDIEVSRDVRALQGLIRRTLPDSRIIVDMIGDKVILRGQAKHAGEAQKAVQLARQFGKDVVNAMTIGSKDQVVLKVRIAEVQRSAARQFGINWTALINTGVFTAQVISANPFSLGQVLGGSVASSVPGLTDLGMASNGVGITGNAGTMGAVVRAMEREGFMRLLAEPTLTAVSGETAKFLAGGEVPIPTAYDSDSNTVSYTMKPFGVVLGFTPVVQSDGRIVLKVKTEVSEVSNKHSAVLPNGVTMPGFEKRSANTTVELPSGGTLAIGGLIKDQTKHNIDGVPGLKKLPILGALFRSRDYQSEQSELVILVTAYIVRPGHASQFVTPADRVGVPNDERAILFGRLSRTYGGGRGGEKGRVYHGAVGFIVE